MSTPTTGLLERPALTMLARDNLRQLALLRTVAISGQTIALAFVQVGLGIPLPIVSLACAIGILALFNLGTWLRLRVARPVSDIELLVQILVDITVLTVLLYFTGGANNPFSAMYVLPLVMAATMLPWAYTWLVAAVSGACYVLLIFTNMPLLHETGEPVYHTLWHSQQFLAAMAITFLITAGLIPYFVVRIRNTLREHDRLLAKARENELNNARIVQLGAFAAGAAHELSTPLATMAVVVKELRAGSQGGPELLNELRVVSDQIELCKRALSNLLASAGQTRMDSGGRVALDDFLKSVVDKCRSMRPKVVLTCRCHGSVPVPEIVAEQSVRQAILNLLNNAADASPDHVEVEGKWNEKEFLIRICDAGSGISAEAVDKIGKEFFTTKPLGQGNGMGLVLTNAIITRFGGSLTLFNRPEERGACTEVRLPLAPFLVMAGS